MRIMVIGDSVAIWIRPARRNRNEKPYTGQLEGLGEVINLARPGLTAADAAELWFLDGAKRDPDVVVLQVGLNDAVPRLLPRSVWLWFNFRIKHRFDTMALIGKAIIRLIDRFTPMLIKALRIGPWGSLNAFRGSMSTLLDMIAKETQARVFLITIPPTTDRVEKALPGSNRSIQRYNQVLLELAGARGATVIDLYEYVVQSGTHEVLPEGIHASAIVHQWIAEQITATLDGNRGLDD